MIGKQNLFLQSVDLANAAWTKSNCTMTPMVNGPDGTTGTANTMTDSNDGGSTIHIVYESYITSSNRQHTISVIAKAGTKHHIELWGTSGPADYCCYFDLSNGTVGTSVNLDMPGRIFALGNGWYKCEITITPTASTAGFTICDVDGSYQYTGNGTGTIYLYQPQVVQANWAGEYVKTYTTAVNIAAPPNKRYPQNLCKQSEALSTWMTEGSPITVTDNYALAPNLTTTASRVVFTNGSFCYIYLNSAMLSIKKNIYYTISMWVKSTSVGAGQSFRIRVTKNLTTSNTEYTTTNSWQRISWTYMSNDDATLAPLISSAAGNPAADILIWGVQFEQSNFAGEYVKTTTTQLDTNTIRSLNPSENLLTYSGDLTNTSGSSPWGTPTNMTISSPTIAGAPDGSSTAQRLTETTATGAHSTRQNTISNIISGQPYTLSFFVKAETRFYVAIYGNAGDGSSFQFFNISAGTKLSGGGVSFIKSEITPSLNGWFRISLTYIANTNGAYAPIYLASADNTTSYTGSASNTLLIWGAQLCKGTSPGNYSATTSAQIYYGGSRNLIPRAINRLQYSSINNFGVSGTTVDASPVISPDNTLSAYMLREIDGGTYHYVYSPLIYVPTGCTVTISMDIKDAGRSWFAYRDLSVIDAWRQINTGEALPNGFYRHRFVYVQTNAAVPRIFLYPTTGDGILSYSGDSTKGIIVANVNAAIGNTYDTVATNNLNNQWLAVQPTSEILRNIVGSQNLLLQSQTFDSSAWDGKYQASISPNVDIAPDGTLTADRLIEDNANEQHMVWQSQNGVGGRAPILIPGRIYTQSVYAKAGSASRYLILSATATVAPIYTWFDIINGAIGTRGANVLDSRISIAPRGYYRCEITFIATAAGTLQTRYQISNADGSLSYTGDSTSYITLWGAQLEQADSSHDYLPTTTAIIDNGAPRKSS
jgi:hypothetical protein